MADPATLFDKIWGAHAIVVRPDGATLLHIDRHLVHDGSNNAFRFLQEKNLKVRRPDRTFATPDHYVSTLGRGLTAINDPNRRSMVEGLKAHAQETGVTLFDLGDKRQGIVHVVGPEQGLSQPGMVIVCGDSHTATHGAMGAFAFGIGASEVGHVLATQTLWQKKPKNMRITVDGTLAPGVHSGNVAVTCPSFCVQKNVTITLEEEALRWARREAADKGLSVSKFLRQMLEKEYRRTGAYWKATSAVGHSLT